jgi:enoyl-CoA hydratase/carnithine racemase
MSHRVTLEKDGPIAHVALARPEKLNGLDLLMLRELVSTARAIDRDRSIRAVVLRGEGDAFSSGLDFAAVAKQPVAVARAFAKVPRLQKLNLFQRACWAWRELPLPVVAALHGRAYGGGLQLALACDFRVATPDCELSVMEAKWGLVPDMTGSVSLRELVPIDVAKRLTITAETFDGRRALELGLVTELADDPAARALELAAEVSARSPDAVASAKRLFQRSWTASERKAFWTESREQARLLRGRNHVRARRSGGAPDSWSDREH